MKHVGIEIKFYNLDTFKKQINVNFIDLDGELVDLNYLLEFAIIGPYPWGFLFEKTEILVES